MKRAKSHFNSIVFSIGLIAVMVVSVLLNPASASTPQGKGGEIKPAATPSPAPKKTTTPKRSPAPRRSASSSSSRAGKAAGEAAKAAEIVFWNSIKDSTNPEDFKAYLKRYPNGEFAELATNKLKTLEPGTQPVRATNSTAPDSTKTSTAMPPNPPLPLHSFDFVTVMLDKDGKLRSRETKSAYAFTEDLGGEDIRGVKLEMVAIPPGEFMMGSPEGEAGRFPNEGPQHRVRIGYWFYIGKFEVTQAQWRALMGNSPSFFKDCDECPVEQVSWDDATEFCRKLSARTGRAYRLPSEAEWEYSARAGTTTPFAFGDTITPEIVNYDGRFPYANASEGRNRDGTVAVGSLGVANGFGLYDMHGNVMEWCDDWYHETYEGAPNDGSAWLRIGQRDKRVHRGGPASSYAFNSRSAVRAASSRDWPFYYTGFRVVAIARTQ